MAAAKVSFGCETLRCIALHGIALDWIAVRYGQVWPAAFRGHQLGAAVSLSLFLSLPLCCCQLCAAIKGRRRHIKILKCFFPLPSSHTINGRVRQWQWQQTQTENVSALYFLFFFLFFFGQLQSNPKAITMPTIMPHLRMSLKSSGRARQGI